MTNKSIWLENKKDFNFKSLKENLEVDVLIIGGGITGVSLLYDLRNTNLKVCLVERNKIGEGVTSKTTAKLNYLQGIVYSKIVKDVSKNAAKRYLNSQIEGINHVIENIKNEKIDCNIEKVSSYVYGTKEKDIKGEYEFLKENGINVTKEDLSLKVDDTYVFHPLKYIESLVTIVAKKNNLIFENTEIIDLEKVDVGYICKTKEAIIHAKKVVLACHYPFKLFPFFLPTRTYIEKSYVIATKVKDNPKITYITDYPNIHSKRYYKDKGNVYEIELGLSHNTCVKGDHKENFRKLIENKSFDYIWSNEDIMTSDHLPFIGFIKKDLLLATGYNTWGMSSSAIASLILKDILLGKENKYTEVFKPYRSLNLAKIKQYPINILGNLKSFIGPKLKKEKDWYPKNLTFKKENGTLIAIYKENNKEYKVTPICPHVGCTLIFNELEKTWDCPCHASRFDLSGKCIKGPSLKDITYHDKL